MRFGLISLPSNPTEVLEAATLSEQLGYDALYCADHLFAFFAPDMPFLDGWATLGAWVQRTTTIRLGPLVANLSWRNPVQMARTVIALDQLSGGRIDLGVGAGRFGDQVMGGMHDMSGSERVARLDEGLVVLDRLLRNDLEPFSGRFTTYDDARTTPGCVQQPRPALVVAAHGPKALRVAAQRGDVWSSYGGVDSMTVDELLAVTRQRNDGLREACDIVGRDPASIGRSLLLLTNNGVDPWGDPDALRAFVAHLHDMNFDELVLGMPSAGRRAEFERVSLDVVPQLR
jgi:alkanesulfonate monooxygenase SsuD/methylene tetrahydromethanopterin reductase-like flavin-dependent oxidoreductase (luciferase family)